MLKILPCDIHLLTQMSKRSSKLSMKQIELKMMESKTEQHIQGINSFDGIMTQTLIFPLLHKNISEHFETWKYIKTNANSAQKLHS